MNEPAASADVMVAKAGQVAAGLIQEDQVLTSDRGHLTRRTGYAYGELRIGCSKKSGPIRTPAYHHGLRRAIMVDVLAMVPERPGIVQARETAIAQRKCA